MYQPLPEAAILGITCNQAAAEVFLLVVVLVFFPNGALSLLPVPIGLFITVAFPTTVHQIYAALFQIRASLSSVHV